MTATQPSGPTAEPVRSVADGGVAPALPRQQIPAEGSGDASASDNLANILTAFTDRDARTSRVVLQVAGWPVADARERFRWLSAVAGDSPVLHLDTAAHGDLRGVLDAARDSFEQTTRKEALRLRRYDTITSIMDCGGRGRDEVSIRQRISGAHFRSWYAFAAVLPGVGAALMEGSGDRWGGWWWSGLVTLCLGTALLLPQHVSSFLDLRRLQRFLRSPGYRGDYREIATWADDGGGDRRRYRDDVLAGAFLRDLVDEWRTFRRLRRWRGPYPVLFVTHDGQQTQHLQTVLRQYAHLARVTAVVVTDREVEPDWLPAAAAPDQLPELLVRIDLTRPPAIAAVRGTRRLWRGLRDRLLTYPSARAGVALVLLVGAAVPVSGSFLRRAWIPYCAPGSGDSDVRYDGAEWIGYRFCVDPLALVHRGSATGQKPFDLGLIYRENKRVDALVAAGTARKAVTIVMITSLTRKAAGPRSLIAEYDGLAGAYAAQRRINTMANRSQPYVRFAVANAGDGAGGIAALKDSVLRLLAKRGTQVVGAVVTVDSKDAVRAALTQLDATGLIMASPTMTADRFAADMDNFFQLTSTNDDQVRLVAGFVRKNAPTARFVTVFPANSAGDSYVNSLAAAMRRHAPSAQTVRWRSSADANRGPAPGVHARDLRVACADPLAPQRPVVFYGGRYLTFAEFVQDLQLECGANVPLLIADDSVSRFLTDEELAGGVPHGTEVVIAHRGELLSCRSLRENDAAQARGATRMTAGRWADFLEDIQRELNLCRTGSSGSDDAAADARLAGGWAAMSYDTVRLLNDAMLRARRITGTLEAATLRPQMRTLLAVQDPQDGHSYAGVYGPIQFDRHRMARRQVALYCVPELSEAFVTGSPANVATKIGSRDRGLSDLSAVDGDSACSANTPSALPSATPR